MLKRDIYYDKQGLADVMIMTGSVTVQDNSAIEIKVEQTIVL